MFRGLVLSSIPFVVVICLMTAGERPARAQASMHFDSASVKPSEPGNVRGATFQFLPGGNLRIVNGTLKALIESAYDVRDFQILDATGWMAADRFDISAKSPADGPATDPAENIKATRLRLQSLLADRFHLKVRREKRDLPEYALRLAKRGFQLEPAPADGRAAAGGIEASCGRMIGTRASMTQFTARLSREFSRPVIDETGLGGRYSFQIDWTPDVGPCSTANPGAVLTSAASIFTALEERLGLKLEPIKGAVDVVVVDHAERPSPD